MKKSLDNLIIPFGKYKGKPIDILKNDLKYSEWLANQNWFREKHNEFYTIIINNFNEPDDTPEHNALQSKFLNNIYIDKFLKIYLSMFEIKFNNLHVDTYGFEPDIGGDVEISIKWEEHDQHYSMLIIIEIKPSIGDDYPSILRSCKRIQNNFSNKNIRNLGWHIYKNFTFCNVVVMYDKYEGKGVTEKDMKKIFFKSGIAIIPFLSLD